MKRNAIVGPNPIHPNYLTAEERVNELGRILAQGLLRLHDAAKSNSQTVSTERVPHQIRGQEKGELKNLSSCTLTNQLFLFTVCSSYQLRRTVVLLSTAEPTKLELVLYGSSVPAGFPSPADDHIEGKLDLNEHIIRHPAATFFARATGESMKDAGIFHGDLLVVDRSLTAQSDDIVIAVLHGDLTVKRLRNPNGAWVLAAANPLFPDLPINDAGCEVWGVVTHSIRRHCDR